VTLLIGTDGGFGTNISCAHLPIHEDFVDDLFALTPKWPGWLRKTISSLAGAKGFIP
jgi:hypothetical protein